jgi:Ca-activated chloride channel family protein
MTVSTNGWGFSFRLFCRVFTSAILLALMTADLRGDHDDEKDEGSPPTLSWQIQSSHLAVKAGKSEFFLRIRVKAAKVETDREPISLSIVIDRSGSMKEDSKIGYVRQAVHLVTDNLTSDDHVAFIAYNHLVHVLVPLHKMVNREYLHHRIDELTAEGYTNLSAGMLEGCAQLHKQLDKPGLHHVILLTDGLANRGVTNANSLVRLVDRCTRHGITLTTVGLGTEYNEQLLARMAQAGGGRYIYVAEPDKIPAAFEKELGALLDVVAQNTKLQMQLPLGVELLQVFGQEKALKPEKLELQLGDMTSGEERVVLVKVRATSARKSTGPIELNARLTYDDIADAQRRELEQTVSIKQLAAGVTVAAKPGPVLAYAELVQAVDKIALAVHGMDRKLAAEVLEIRRRRYPVLKQVAIDSRDQEFYNKAFMFEHYARELQALVDIGALHEHSTERARLQKELHYRRYLMQHHAHDH